MESLKIIECIVACFRIAPGLMLSIVSGRIPVDEKKVTFQIQLEMDHNETQELQNYNQNGEFSLESYDAKKCALWDGCCPKPFSSVDYVIRIKRRTAFFVVSYVIPMVVINIFGMMLLSTCLKIRRHARCTTASVI